MKFVHLLGLLGFLAACSSSQRFVNIPPKKEIKVDIPVQESVNVNLKNKSLKDVEVQVIHPTSGEFVSGFGLGPKGKATIFVEKGNILQIKNTNNTQSSVTYTYEQTTPPTTTGKDYVTFTLANKSVKSIPLIIPSVMNPNLSPMSNSGVDLKIGQKIFFKKGGKKYLLLEVDTTIKDGDVIVVNKLLAERKRALNI